MKGPFTLVPTKASQSTGAAISELAQREAAGEVMGLAYTVMTKGRHYETAVAGECRRNPTYTVGMLLVLVFRLLKKIVSAD